MIRPSAPKAGALPDCATPRRADARRFTGDQTQAESDVRGNERQNMAGTGEVSPEIVPSGTDPVFQTRAELVAALRGLYDDLVCLINDSTGVYGLHLNGDPAEWDDLLTGGRFEEWLGPAMDRARVTLSHAHLMGGEG